MPTNGHTYEIIGNDPFNVKILNETLWDIKEMMFNNLYDAQKSLADMDRFDIDMAEFANVTNTEYVYHIASQFISNDSRIQYRNSKFYKKDISFDDIVSNPNIFYNTILIFINGELYTNFYVRPYEDFTNIVFKVCHKFPSTPKYVRNGFTFKEMKDFVDSHAQMTILFVNNHNETNFETNRPTLNNYALVDKYLGLPMVNFKPKNNIHFGDNFLSCVTVDDERLYKYRLLTTEMKHDPTINGKKLYFDKEEIKTLTNQYTFLKNIYLLNYMSVIDVAGGTEYFELPIKDMPIPIENMLIFRKSNNKLLFDHDTRMTLHYPNIYKINSEHTDDLRIYVYYADDTVSIGTKYENELALYYRFNQNILDQYKDGSIPDLIKNYEHIRISYDNKDLKNQNIDHLEYKYDKLSSMIRQNGNYYSIYLNKLVGYVPTFFIDVSKIEDLASRYRTHNRLEIKDPDNQADFSEPCYLFTFRHDSNNDKMNITIDDYQSNELYEYNDDKYTYVYIPMRLINPNSIIYVEKFIDYRYRHSMVVSNNENYHKITLPERQKIRPSDIYISTKNISGEEIYLTKNDYKLYTYRDGEYFQITINDFYPYPNLYVKFVNPVDIGKRVSINIDRVTFKQVVKGSNSITINRPINNDVRNILLYRNGRLIPEKIRQYKFSDNVNGPHIVRAPLLENFDDEYTLIYNTNKYYLVHYQERINSKGIVNLTDIISKPIDFKWYDIYLNGLKLDISNIDLLGPYIMIIKNVPTLTNLEIYQKNLDSYDVKNYYYDSDDISSKIFDLISKDIEDTLDDIVDTIPNIMDDIINDALAFLNEYLYTVIKLINPDISQITEQMQLRYSTTFDDNGNLFMNPDATIRLEDNIYLQPDKGTIIL